MSFWRKKKEQGISYLLKRKKRGRNRNIAFNV